MTSREQIRKDLKAGLESIYVNSRVDLDDQVASDKDVRAFVEENLDEFCGECWSFVMRGSNASSH